MKHSDPGADALRPALDTRDGAGGVLVRSPGAGRAYAELLATEGVVRGLIGPREAPRLWDRHLLNSAVLAEAIPDDATVCDIGTWCRPARSGAGHRTPRPHDHARGAAPAPDDLPRRRWSTSWVSRAVEVVRGRADALHGDRTFDVVTSRAVAPLERLLGWSMPLVSPTGAMVAMKGQSVVDEITEAQDFLHTWRCGVPEVFEAGYRNRGSTDHGGAGGLGGSDPGRLAACARCAAVVRAGVAATAENRKVPDVTEESSETPVRVPRRPPPPSFPPGPSRGGSALIHRRGRFIHSRRAGGCFT